MLPGFAGFKETMTVKYKYLDCERVDSVLHQIDSQLTIVTSSD